MAEMKVSKELFQKLAACKSAQEVIVSLEDAEKFIAQLSNEELSLENVEKIAGGEPCVGAVSFGCVGIGIA